MTRKSLLVSICCITYNHENFIREAIDSFLMQKTNFPIEIIIHDDASTDNTANIIREYQAKHPNLIKPIFQTQNQYSIRGFGFLSDMLEKAEGKYIALCEGDDYWTDTLKLQKQVDFLEANPDFAICFHNAAVINESFPERNGLNNNDSTPEISTLDDLLKGANYITTASVVIRTNLIQKLPNWFTLVPFGDYALYLIAARYGNIKYINEVMSVYRIHSGGIHGNFTNSYAGLTKAYQEHYEFWQIINKSGLFDRKLLKPAILKTIENVIEYAYFSKQISIFFEYNYLLLLHGEWGNLGKIAKNILRLCLYPLRKIKNYFVKTQIELLK